MGSLTHSLMPQYSSQIQLSCSWTHTSLAQLLTNHVRKGLGGWLVSKASSSLILVFHIVFMCYCTQYLLFLGIYHCPHSGKETYLCLTYTPLEEEFRINPKPYPPPLPPQYSFVLLSAYLFRGQSWYHKSFNTTPTLI